MSGAIDGKFLLRESPTRGIFHGIIIIIYRWGTININWSKTSDAIFNHLLDFSGGEKMAQLGHYLQKKRMLTCFFPPGNLAQVCKNSQYLLLHYLPYMATVKILGGG